MARPSHQALAAAATGVSILLLGGCGSSPAPAATPLSSPEATAQATLSTHFCAKASEFTRHMPAEPKATGHRTPAQAQADMSKVLVSTVHGFATLEKEAPAKLRKPLRKIISVYKSDEKVLRTTGDMSRVSQSMIQRGGTGSAAAAYHQVLKYVSAHCH
ncbi:MAG: hypothetical protein ACRDNZ_00185 [Streptosporangiaceae bacterium]